MGEWSLEKSKSSGVILSNGVYHIDNIKKFRGFNTKLDIINLLEQNLDKKLISLYLKKNLSYIHKNLKIFNEIINDYEKKIDLTGQNDKKRIWEKYNLTAKDLLKNNYKSIPMNINNIEF